MAPPRVFTKPLAAGASSIVFRLCLRLSSLYGLFGPSISLLSSLLAWVLCWLVVFLALLDTVAGFGGVCRPPSSIDLGKDLDGLMVDRRGGLLPLKEVEWLGCSGSVENLAMVDPNRLAQGGDGRLLVVGLGGRDGVAWEDGGKAWDQGLRLATGLVIPGDCGSTSEVGWEEPGSGGYGMSLWKICIFQENLGGIGKGEIGRKWEELVVVEPGGSEWKWKGLDGKIRAVVAEGGGEGGTGSGSGGVFSYGGSEVNFNGVVKLTMPSMVVKGFNPFVRQPE